MIFLYYKKVIKLLIFLLICLEYKFNIFVYADDLIISPFSSESSESEEVYDDAFFAFSGDLELLDKTSGKKLSGEIESETLFRANRNEESIVNPQNLLSIREFEEILKLRLNYDSDFYTNIPIRNEIAKKIKNFDPNLVKKVYDKEKLNQRRDSYHGSIFNRRRSSTIQAYASQGQKKTRSR